MGLLTFPFIIICVPSCCKAEDIAAHRSLRIIVESVYLVLFLVAISCCTAEDVAAYRNLQIIVKSAWLPVPLLISWLREIESTRISESSSFEVNNKALLAGEKTRAYNHNPWQLA